MSHELIQSRIRDLYIPDALKIRDSLGNDPLLIVTGPMRSGKSESLIPLLGRTFTGAGRLTRVVDFQAFNPFDPEDVDYRFEGLPHTSNGVLIADEANYVCRLGISAVQRALELTHESGYALVAVVTYHPSRPELREDYVNLLQTTGKRISGTTANVHDIHAKLLDDQLARDVLIQGVLNPPSEEVIDFVLSTVPPHHWILESLREAATIEQARMVIYSNTMSWEAAGVITWEQMEEIRQKSYPYQD